MYLQQYDVYDVCASIGTGTLLTIELYCKKKKTTKQFNNKIKVSVAWLKAKAKATRRE